MHAAHSLRHPLPQHVAARSLNPDALVAHRRAMIGSGLDDLVRTDSAEPAITDDLMSGLMLLLHLCNPAQYGANIAATACAAVAVPAAEGCGIRPHHSSRVVRLITVQIAGVHSGVLVAAMRHDGLAALLARERHDAVAVLADLAYQTLDDASGEARKTILRRNDQMFEAFAAGAVQVSHWTCCHQRIANVG